MSLIGGRLFLRSWLCFWEHLFFFLVSRTGTGGWTKRPVKMPNETPMRSLKEFWPILTAGRWPRKSESAKECVRTHLLNRPAPKMDTAGATDRCRTITAKSEYKRIETVPRRAQKPMSRARVVPTVGADLGGSSKYSNETLEYFVQRIY